ncbi:FeoB-associated Cys-rich membrane protein [Victivallis sp. Marseille-Q1083]|uniref:FeoB-associated Cys-rich membrane protein n=1 Tax=Victivallis sp. Marseille-Q1083 TaxID=2717288 RepID=UPI00158C09AB|nr:FeoB-associated Cys-rich membrane protein [Victivallis sp. Marseille-Q1083]
MKTIGIILIVILAGWALYRYLRRSSRGDCCCGCLKNCSADRKRQGGGEEPKDADR